MSTLTNTENQIHFIRCVQSVYDAITDINENAIYWITDKGKIYLGSILMSCVIDLPYVTPQMFSAVADGVTDDTEAVQAALSAGGVVYFPAGVYKVTKQLTTTKPCKIMMYKQYPSRYWRSGSTSGRYDYPIIIADGESDYQDEKGWGFGARLECYPSTVEGETIGLLIGDGCEVDGLFMRAMNGFSGVLLKYEDKYEYGTDNLGDSITYQSYPSSMRFKHIRLDCDRHNTTTTVPQSMFNFCPKDNYFHLLEDIVIGQQNEFATYGFRCVVNSGSTSDTDWANSVRITNLALNGLFDYPFYIEGSYTLTNWVIEGLTIQTFGYNYGEYEPTREGHKAVITLKNMAWCLFSGCYIWDLYQAKFTKLFDTENITNVSCVGCSYEFDYGTINHPDYKGDIEEAGIETVLAGRLKQVSDDANLKSLTMTSTTLEDGTQRISLSDTHENVLTADIPPVTLSDEQVSTGVTNWMDANSMPREEIGKNKFNISSTENFQGTLGKSNGAEYANESMFTSHFIEAKKGDVIRYKGDDNNTTFYELHYYDSSKNHIGYLESAHTYELTDENTAYIRCSWILKRVYSDSVVDGESSLCLTINNTDTTYEPYGIELVGGLSQYFMLQSPNGTRYTITVTDDGTLVAEEVTS